MSSKNVFQRRVTCMVGYIRTSLAAPCPRITVLGLYSGSSVRADSIRESGRVFKFWTIPSHSVVAICEHLRYIALSARRFSYS